MPEYDAFGREIGEDTLAETGWSTGSGQAGSPLPPPPPVPSGSPLPPPPPPPSAFDAGTGSPFPPPPPPSAVQQAAEAGFRDFAPQPVVRQRKGVGCGLVGFVVAAAVISAIAWGVIALVGAVEEGVDTARDFVPSIPTVTTPGAVGGGTEERAEAPAPPEEPPVGLRKGSLVRRAEFGKAMRQLRAARLGNLRTLRVAPDRIDVQTLTKGGALRNVQLTPGGGLQKLGTPTPGFGHLDTMPYSIVSSAAPERLVRAAAKRLGKSSDRVDYLVLLDFGGTPQWSVFFRAGEQFQADRAGRIFRRVN